MKPQEAKERYILLRAEGKSYDAIAQELHISNSTCSAWEKELEQAIADRKAEQLEQLYDSYYMKKEARIKQLGGTLANIEDALAAADLTQMQPKELLEYKLKYIAALKEEYTGKASGYAYRYYTYCPISSSTRPIKQSKSWRGYYRAG